MGSSRFPKFASEYKSARNKHKKTIRFMAMKLERNLWRAESLQLYFDA
jgi:hypothetical protein